MWEGKQRARREVLMKILVVDDSVSMRAMLARRRLQKLLGIFLEFLQAMMTAEMITSPVVDVAQCRVAGAHLHSADGIG
jgi:hypothetical protein